MTATTFPSRTTGKDATRKSPSCPSTVASEDSRSRTARRACFSARRSSTAAGAEEGRESRPSASTSAQAALRLAFRLLQQELVLLGVGLLSEEKDHQDAEDDQDEGKDAHVAQREPPAGTIEHHGVGPGRKV